MHRALIFGKRASSVSLSPTEHRNALKMLEQANTHLPKSTVLRCKVRYFTDGAILGRQDFVLSFMDAWQVH